MTIPMDNADLTSAGDIGRQLFQFAAKSGMDTKKIDAAFSVKRVKEEQLHFELLAFRVFTVDFMAYNLISEPPYKQAVMDAFYAPLKELANKRWPEDGFEGLKQRLELYSYAIKRHPEEIGLGIVEMFCKLCDESSEPFAEGVTQLFLSHIRAIQPMLGR